ncbi:MAG TPA: DUF502 domain-containing protein, partial [Firmicutes bacterium]|nr:DUF502 domain-containing protein [Bacillota bacterium]
MFKRIRKAFLTGLLLVLPSAVTIYFLWVGLKWVDGLLIKPLNALFGIPIPGLGLILLFIFITLVGVLGTNFLVKKLWAYYERLARRIPLVGSIYGTVKQLTETLSSKDKLVFRSVVMVEYPRTGVYATGFLLGEPLGGLPDNYREVFVPTVPNPTSGFLVNFPEKDLIYLDLSVEDAL